MIYLNNKLVPEGKALISVFDHGFLYGDGIYETLRAYKGTVFMLDEHMDRLFRSASMIGLMVPQKPGTIKKAVYNTMEANRLDDAVIRITVSRGAGPPGLDPDLCPKPTFVIFASAFKKYPGQYYRKGVKVAIVNTRRNYNKALDPQIKSLNFLNNILAKIEAKKAGAYEAIMLNYRGYIAEGTISNVFFAGNNVLCTPSINTGILDGITRRIILDIAKELKIKTMEGNFRPEEIYNAQEIFISNTTMEVMPVTEIDNKKISPAPGKITKMLNRAYRRKVAGYIKGENKA
ncbi:MAG TPA: branched-chain amino acid aminotransferase [Nitrospirae bacterium]|nr:branched-chain amino acid aminotransferase [Nitrospirota bacterium]